MSKKPQPIYIPPSVEERKRRRQLKYSREQLKKMADWMDIEFTPCSGPVPIQLKEHQGPKPIVKCHLMTVG